MYIELARVNRSTRMAADLSRTGRNLAVKGPQHGRGRTLDSETGLRVHTHHYHPPPPARESDMSDILD